jgi:UrcA family protein
MTSLSAIGQLSLNSHHRDLGEGRFEMFARFNPSHGGHHGRGNGLFHGCRIAFDGQDSDVVVRGLPEGTKVEMVSYGDLNLRLIAHLDILNDRVGRAVRRVCDFEPRDPLMSEGYRDCADLAWASARPQIHRAYLQANRLATR